MAAGARVSITPVLGVVARWHRWLVALGQTEHDFAYQRGHVARAFHDAGPGATAEIGIVHPDSHGG